MTTLSIEQGGNAVAVEQGAALSLDAGSPTVSIEDGGGTVSIEQPRSLTVAQDSAALAVSTEQVTIALDHVVGGNGVVLYDAEATLLADALSDGTVAYARNTNHFWFRQDGAWHQRIGDDSGGETITVARAYFDAGGLASIFAAPDGSVLYQYAAGAWQLQLSSSGVTVRPGKTLDAPTVIVSDRLSVPVDVAGIAARDVRWNSAAEALEYFDGSAWHDSGSPKYILLKATGQSAGDMHLSASTWATSKALIETLRVVTTSEDWDLCLLQNDNGHVADDANVPELLVVEQGNGDAVVQLRQPYEDEDASNEVHLYVANNDTGHPSATFDFYIAGSKLR